jgi:D-alanyl-D-alanine carboxypeptidase
MTSSQATSRPRIPRRGADASAPVVRVGPPPRRRTTTRANAPHVVPFDAAWDARASLRPVEPVAVPSPAVDLPVREATAPPENDPAVGLEPAVDLDPVVGLDLAAAPETAVAPETAAAPEPEVVSDHAPRPARRTALLVGVPVVVVALGLAAVALGATGGPGSPAAASGADVPPSAAQGGVAAPPATGLDPELERRFVQAAEAASAEGVELTLTSGWRSAEEQAGLVEAAVARYGSDEEARRWVLPPERSAHVAGLAIDVGPTEGALWLEQHGADHGLCRVYANELWHFEPVVEPGGTCPALLPDSTSGWDGL